MKKSHIMTLDWLIVLGCTYLTLHGLASMRMSTHILNTPVASLSFIISLGLYYCYRITLDRRILYVPIFGFIPVVLGQSSICWSIEWYSVNIEFVWKELELRDVTHLTKLGLDYFLSSLTEGQVLGIGIVLTMAVISLRILNEVDCLTDELDHRGAEEIDQVNTGCFWRQVDTLIVSAIIIGWGILLMERVQGLVQIKPSGILMIIPGLIGSLLLQRTIGVIFGKEWKEE